LNSDNSFPWLFKKIWFVVSSSQHYLFRITRIFPIEKTSDHSSSTQ